MLFFLISRGFRKKISKEHSLLVSPMFCSCFFLQGQSSIFLFSINIPNVLPNHTIPETKAEEDAVNIPILSCVRDPYPPARTLTVEDIIDITAKKNDILSKSEKIHTAN